MKTVCERHTQLQGFLLSCTQLASLVGFLSKLEGIPNYYFPELKFFLGVSRCRQTADLEGPWAGLRPQTKDIADGTLAMHNG